MPDQVNEPAAFGIDALALDDRLRLFHFTAATNSAGYLRVLRAFERARELRTHRHRHDPLPGDSLAHVHCRLPAPLRKPGDSESLKGAAAPSPWDPELAAELTNRGRAVMEERRIPTLLGDLA